MVTVVLVRTTLTSALVHCGKEFEFSVCLFSATQSLINYVFDQLDIDAFQSDTNRLTSSLDTSYTWKIAPALENQKLEYQVYPSTVISRLASFRPLLFIERPESLFFSLLSSSGFYYTRIGTTVECQSCGKRVELINFKSSPSDHTYHIPGCPFIDPAINTAENLMSNQSQSNEQSVILDSSLTNSLEANPEDSTRVRPVQQQNHQRGSEILNLAPNSVNFTNSAYPLFSSIQKRLASLTQQWPGGHTHTPSELAKAGFFYAGYSDCVRCFHCGLGLRSWRPGDDINIQHERFRPTCQYMLTLLRNGIQGHQECQNSQNEISETVNVINDATTLGSSATVTTSTLLETAANATSQFCSSLPSNVAVSDASSADQNQENVPTLSLTKSLLQRENQVLKDQMKCKSCKVSPVQDLFLPCGEMYTCKDCSNKFTHCPSCGKRILGTVTVFFA